MKNFIEFLKLPWYLLLALAVASGFLLFMPEKVIMSLYMAEFRNQYGFVIGTVFIVSISILFAMVVKWVYNFVVQKYDLKTCKKEQERLLLNLSKEKVEVVQKLLNQRTHTLMLPMNNGLIVELQYYDIISPAGQTHITSAVNPQINFFLQPWVIERIKENEELQKKFYIE